LRKTQEKSEHPFDFYTGHISNLSGPESLFLDFDMERGAEIEICGASFLFFIRYGHPITDHPDQHMHG
jgi:hypothetical protein